MKMIYNRVLGAKQLGDSCIGDFGEGYSKGAQGLPEEEEVAEATLPIRLSTGVFFKDSLGSESPFA